LNIKNLLAAALALALGFTTASAQVPGAPLTMTYQGTLSDIGGQAVNGTRTIAFRLYSERAGGEALWNEVHPDLDVSDGSFSVVLGEVNPIPADLDPAVSLWLGVQVDDDAELQPRMRVGGALRAQWAAVAAQALDVAGRHIHPSAVSIGQTPVIDGQGRWVGDPAGLQGPAGDRGPAGADGPAGPAGRQGDSGPAGRQGEPGPAGVAGEQGPPGPQGVPGPQGPVGPEGRSLSLAEDSDGDGYADWIEVTVGTDPLDLSSVPEDLDADGVPDALQGPPGTSGPVGPAGPPGPAGAVGPQGPPGPAGADSAKARYLGLSNAITYCQDGLSSLQNACAATFAGSRMCTTTEYYQTGSPPPVPESAFIKGDWVPFGTYNDPMYGIQALVMDRSGFVPMNASTNYATCRNWSRWGYHVVLRPNGTLDTDTSAKPGENVVPIQGFKVACCSP
jgi:hypothetical protein